MSRHVRTKRPARAPASYRCYCNCTVCGASLCRAAHCPIRPFARLYDLYRKRDPKLSEATWWAQVREARDGTLIVLRAGPDHTLDAEGRQWWADALAEVEAWSVRLEAAYQRYAIAQTYPLMGTA